MANTTVNYEDPRFAQVEENKNAALSELEQTYSSLIGESDKYYQAQIDASKQWADKQSQLQQEQTDFAIEQIQQQKDQSHKDYIKEQSGAYVDWQKQSNQYGNNAEQMASAGMTNTGFSESSQVGMYNTYQNRVATAREVFAQATLAYDNNIKEARLQNNAVLAEIYANAYAQQLELSLQGFQYKNNLIQEQANRKTELENMHYNRYLDVLNQINTENAMAEEIRQYNQNYDLQVKQYNEGIRQFEIEIERLKAKDAKEYEMQIQELELQKQKAEEAKRQFEAEMAFKREQLAEEQRQFNLQYNKSRSSGGGGGGGGGSVEQLVYYNGKPTLDKSSQDPKGTGLSIVNSPFTVEAAAKRVASGEYTARQEGNKVYLTKNEGFVPPELLPRRSVIASLPKKKGGARGTF